MEEIKKFEKFEKYMKKNACKYCPYKLWAYCPQGEGLCEVYV